MNWGLPPDWSTNGHQIDHLIGLIHWFILALGVFWLGYFLVSLWLFRAGKATATDQPDAPPPSRPARWPLLLVLLVFLFEMGLLLFVEVPLWAERRAQPALEGSFVVRVIGEQYAWNFHYPGVDGMFGRTDPKLIDDFNPVGLDLDDPAAADDLVSINQLHVPAGRRVLLQLGAKDVIHSFYLPYFRVKQDALPGRTIPVWFTPTREGVSEIGCAQLCGLGHYRMRGTLHVESLQVFEAWYAEELAYM